MTDDARQWLNGNAHGAIVLRWTLGVITAVSCASLQNYFAPHWERQDNNTAAIDKLAEKIGVMDERLSRIEGQLQRGNP